jgi:ribosomal silencing factor RsfS
MLIDMGDVVVHFFTPEGRVKYDIENIFAPESEAPSAATLSHIESFKA